MILDSHFPPDPRVENEARSLTDAGHEVHLLCLDYSKRQKVQETLNGIHVHRLRPSKVIYKLSALAYTLPFYHQYFQRKVHAFLTSQRIEAIHIHDMQIARAVFWANQHLQLPTTLDLHENRPEIMKNYGHVASLPGKLLIYPKLWKKYEYRYIQKADHVIVVTHAAKADYIRNIETRAEKFHVVPNTVRPEFYKNYDRHEDIIARYKDQYVLLYLGDTGLRRGLMTALRALPDIISAIPHVKLVIVGKNKQDPILKKFVADQQLENYVDFEGWKDLSYFPSYIIGAQIGICPLHRNPHHDTTFANKLFQYMAFGKPMVVSDCLAQKELIEAYKCGEVFEDRHVTSFVQKVLKLYHDRDHYQTLAQNAAHAIENHLNWNITSKELLNIYQDEGNSSQQ